MEPTITAAEPTAETPIEGTPIDLGDGVERRLRFTVKKLRILKKKFKASFLRGAGILGIDEDQLAEILQVGLEGPDSGKPSIEDLEDRLDMRQIPAIIETLHKAWINDAPKKSVTLEDLEGVKKTLAGIRAGIEMLTGQMDAIETVLEKIEAQTPATTT